MRGHWAMVLVGMLLSASSCSAKFSEVLMSPTELEVIGQMPRVEKTPSSCVGCESVLHLAPGVGVHALARGPTEDDLFVPSLSNSSIYHVSLRSKRSVRIFKGLPGTPSCDLWYDQASNALFSAGGYTGTVSAFYLSSRKPPYTIKNVATVQLGPGVQNMETVLEGKSYLNEVLTVNGTLYASDSLFPHIYKLSVGAFDSPEVAVQKLVLTSPYFDCQGSCLLPLSLRANGFVPLDPQTFLVTNFRLGNIFLVKFPASANSPVTGTTNSTVKATSVVALPLPLVNGLKAWPDTLVHAGGSVFIMGDILNSRMFVLNITLPGQQQLRIANSSSTRVTTNSSSSSRPTTNTNTTTSSSSTRGPTVEMLCLLKPRAYSTPAEVLLKGKTMYSVNAHFFDCLVGQPCPRQPYEVVGLQPEQICRRSLGL